MKESVFLITDVTRMYGREVCVAALDESGRNVRLLPRALGGTTRNHHIDDLRLPDGPIVRPGAMLHANAEPVRATMRPRVENVAYMREDARVTGLLCRDDLLRRLDALCECSMAAVFGWDRVYAPRPYVPDGYGERSLGCVRAETEPQVTLEMSEEGPKARLSFDTDAADGPWDLPVVDLAFLGHLGSGLGTQLPEGIACAMTRSLGQCECIYLRLGLAGPFSKRGNACYVMVIGVHTRPDYLNGKCWADFYPL